MHMRMLSNVAIIALSFFAAPDFAHAQVKPSETLCKERGGLRDCRPPNVGALVHTFQRCDGEQPATDEIDATQRGAAYYYGGCGRDQQIATDGPWQTVTSPGNPICGGGNAVYPQIFLGIEGANAKGVLVKYCFAQNGGYQDGFVVWRRRSITCPDGFGPDNTVGSPNFGLCLPTVGTKCITCCSDSGNCGNPINTMTYNKIETATDIRVPDSPLIFTRTYNSRIDLGAVRLGRKWRHSLERTLEVNYYALSGVVTVVRDDGRRIPFWTTAGGFAVDPDIIDRLTVAKDSTGTVTGWVYTVGADSSVEQYDASGKFISHVWRTGVGISLVYSDTNTPVSIAPSAGLLVSATDTFGRTIRFSYDSDSRIKKVIGPDEGEFTYSYSAGVGNLVSVLFPDTRSRTYVYDELAFITNFSTSSSLTGIIDEKNQRYANFGYRSGLAVMTEHAGGVNRYTLGADTSGGGGTLVFGPLGKVENLARTTIQGVVKLLEHDGVCPNCTNGTLQRYAPHYDANGNQGLAMRPNQNYTAYTYDLTRNLETRRVEGLSVNGLLATVGRTINTTWHSTYRLPATITEPTTAGNKVTSFIFDPAGNSLSKTVSVAGKTRIWAWTYDQYSRVATSTDPNNRIRTNSYYPNDASQGTRRGMLASVANAAGHVATIDGYNAYGQPLSMTDANGLVTTMVYDARQRLTTRTVGPETTAYEYDEVGQVVKVTMFDGSYLAYAYDAVHRLVQIADGLGNRVLYTLDEAGNRIKEDYVVPAGQIARTRSRVYDSLGRLAREIGGANQTTFYRYDMNGNLGQTTDPLNRVTTQLTTAYDALDRMLTSIDTVNGVTQYQYDIQDNLTKVTDPKNLSTVYVYNGFNELTSQVSPDTGTTSFTNDAAGNMLTKTDARGVTATYTYDSLNRVNTISYPAYGGDAAETVTYQYDTCSNGKGRLCSITDKTGTTAYAYNTLGRLTAKSQTVAGLTQTLGYRYNAAGQVDRMTLPSGKSVDYTYTNNRITSVTYDGKPIIKHADYEPFGPIGEWTWGNNSVASPNFHTRYFDLDGRNIKIESGPVNGSIEPTIIVYDAASRITALQKLTANAIDPSKSSTYGYDNLDRLSSVTPNAGNTNPARGFSYDGVGNRLTATLAGSVTNYNYSASSHRLNSLTGSTIKNFSYDNDGNRLTDGTSAWNYGGNNRPTSISIPAMALTVQAGINALGQRVTKTVNGTITRFMYDEAGRLLGEYDIDGKAKQETLWFNDLPVAVIK